MCVSRMCGHMSNLDKLQNYAATIMAHLEDENMAAMGIQGQDISLTGIVHRFEAVRTKLRAIEKLLLKADVLMPTIKPK